MKSTLSILVATSALAALTACGGDGDGTPGDHPIAITSANQTAVVRASLSGGVALALAQGTLGDSTSSTLAARGVLTRALGVARGQRRGIEGASARLAAVSTSTEPCQVGGTLTTAFDDRDGNGMLSSGDVITATFAQCKDAETYSVDGVLVITLTSTPDAANLNASAAFQHVVVVNDGVTSTVGGGVTVHEADNAPITTVTLTSAAGGLSVGIASSGYNDSIVFEQGFAIVATQVGGNPQSSVTMDGSLTATSIGGRVTIATQSPLVAAASDFYPGSGVVKVTGAAGSTVVATALNNTQVQLQIDANGDGSYETTSTVAWSTLLP